MAYYFSNKSSIIDVRLGYIGLLKYWNFQSEAKDEQIIAIVTTCSVSCFILKTKIIKNRLTLVNLEGSEALKRQQTATWFWDWCNSNSSHISVLWPSVLKTLRQPSQKSWPKILTPCFFHSNLYLHILRPRCENIFQIV